MSANHLLHAESRHADACQAEALHSAHMPAELKGCHASCMQVMAAQMPGQHPARGILLLCRHTIELMSHPQWGACRHSSLQGMLLCYNVCRQHSCGSHVHPNMCAKHLRRAQLMDTQIYCRIHCRLTCRPTTAAGGVRLHCSPPPQPINGSAGSCRCRKPHLHSTVMSLT